MSYAATRRLVLAVGLGVLLLVAGVLYVRRVDTVEVLAVLLFIPVFLAFVFRGVVGGVVAGVAAFAAYAALRSPAVEAVGLGRFLGLILSRGLAYVAFGALGGWASSQLERSLEKLDVYDQVDDETGLFNARFLVQDTDLEMARAARYKTLFSVCVVDVPAEVFESLSRRKRSALLAEVGQQLRDAIRSVDRAVHASDGSAHRFAVVCPETGPEGAAVFTDRLAERLQSFLRNRGAPIEGRAVSSVSYTFPGDDVGLSRLREEFAEIDRQQHPENPAMVAGEPAAP